MTLAAIDVGFFVASLEWLFIGYFLLLHGGHTILAAVSVNSPRLRMESVAVKMLPRLSTGYEIPVSIIVPVTGPTDDLVQFVKTLFHLDYPAFEVIVVIDSDDKVALSHLQSAFELVIFPNAYWRQLRARRVRNVYRTPMLPALQVLEKKPGGPGDAINAGVNAARYPIICIAHADAILRRDSLRRLIPDIVQDASTIAAGTAEFVANGSFIVNGFLERCRLSGNPLIWVQTGANLREDLCIRQGWARHNATPAFSDRFCAFRKDVVVQAGGCERDACDPVLELLARLRRLSSTSDARYRVAFVPAPLLWRLAPTTPAAICRKVASERRALANAMRTNRKLLFGHGTGLAGYLAYPFDKLTRVAGPWVELLATIFFFAGFALGLISLQHLIAFLLFAVVLGVLVSWLAILIDAFVFRTYQSAGNYVLLVIAAIFEHTGFRQVFALCAAPSPRPRPTKRRGIEE